MKCLTPDELFAFAMDPLRDENGPVALHIAKCAQCRENYQLALECICEDEYELSAQEEAEAEKAAAELTAAASLWNHFYDKISELGEKFAAPAGNIFKAAALGGLRHEVTFSLAAAARPGAGASLKSASLRNADEDEVKFTFESFSSPEEGGYWKMQMSLPRIPSASALITMKVTGADGAALSGTLDFLNQKTQLCCGVAALPFKTFLENKGCKEISFISGNGAVSPGRIRFLPESLR